MSGLDWSCLRCFTSTGEASSPEDSLWLMGRARYKPVIEYIGGEVRFALWSLVNKVSLVWVNPGVWMC